jgi:hypothetical protein
MGIPVKMVELVGVTVDSTNAEVKVGNTLGDPFQFNVGVKQGDGLSAASFNIALRSIKSNTDQKGTLVLKLSQMCTYACDLVVM